MTGALSRIAALLAPVVLLACGGQAPQIRFYSLVTPRCEPQPDRRASLAIGDLEVDAAYDTDRIVYRTSEYSFSRYHYHRWSASPSRLLADYLGQAYQGTGLFEKVAVDGVGGDTLVLDGRVLAFEEVDRKDTWYGRAALELWLEDPETGEVLWSERFVEVQPLARRHPVGLARALSEALSRIVLRSAPRIAAIAEARMEEKGEEVARAGAGQPRQCELP